MTKKEALAELAAAGDCVKCGRGLKLEKDNGRYLVYCAAMGTLSFVVKSVRGQDAGNAGHTERDIGSVSE